MQFVRQHVMERVNKRGIAARDGLIDCRLHILRECDVHQLLHRCRQRRILPALRAHRRRRLMRREGLMNLLSDYGMDFGSFIGCRGVGSLFRTLLLETTLQVNDFSLNRFGIMFSHAHPL